jgi:uncharacterized protein with GYD domain
MQTFIMTGKYSAEAIKKISAPRTKKAGQIIKQCQGAIVDVYATMGKTDLLVIAKFPGVGEAMKASVKLSEAFGISFATVPALAVDDFDKIVAAKK